MCSKQTISQLSLACGPDRKLTSKRTVSQRRKPMNLTYKANELENPINSPVIHAVLATLPYRTDTSTCTLNFVILLYFLQLLIRCCLVDIVTPSVYKLVSKQSFVVHNSQFTLILHTFNTWQHYIKRGCDKN